MKKTTTVLLLMVLLGGSLIAQPLKDWSELDDKKFAKTATEMLHNTNELKKFARSNDELPKFDKIGLLSFSIFDPASFKKKSLYDYYSESMSTVGGLNLLTALFKETFFAMNARLQENHGTFLLLPENYCDTEEKKKLYEATEFELSNLFKAAAAAEKKIRGGLIPGIKVDIPGLKRVGYANADPKIWRAVGKLAADLDLDCFVIIENRLTTDKNRTFLMSVAFTLVGPNPVPYREDDAKKYAPLGPLKGYLEGVMLGYSNFVAPKNPIEIVFYKDGRMEGMNVKGAGDLYARSLDYLLTDTKAAYDKLKK